MRSSCAGCILCCECGDHDTQHRCGHCYDAEQSHIECVDELDEDLLLELAELERVRRQETTP